MKSHSAIIGDIDMTSSNVISLSSRETSGSPHAPPIPARVSVGCMPENYFATPDGVYFHDQRSNEDEGPVRICSQIAVNGLCRRSDGKGWSRVVDIVDPDGQTHRLLLDESLFTGSPAALLRPLAGCGLQIAMGAAARVRLVDLLCAWRPQEKFVRVSRTGWVDDDFDTFALADGTVIGGKKAILDRETGNIGAMTQVRGSLGDWQETIAANCVDNPLMLLAVSQAFAGPLLDILNLDGGGFHFRGASSRGKTTLLGIAASVWGAPKFVQTWRATDNAMESVASSSSSMLLALDELHMVSPKVAGDVVYMLANGQGKQRMTSGGSARSTEIWKVATLSSGEITLADHMATGGKNIHVGQEIRLIDIEADGRKYGSFDVLHGETDPGLFVEKLAQAAADTHGHVGRKFVERLIENIDQRDGMKEFMNKFVEKAFEIHDLKSDSQVRRVLRRFAVAALAGEMATKFGLTGWKRGEAKDGIFDVAATWLAERDDPRAIEVASALERTRSYLKAHSDRFIPFGSTDELDGWRDDEWFYIPPETWIRIHDVEGAQEAARLHKVANLLKTNAGGTLQYKMGRRPHTSKRPMVYAVNIRVLEIQPNIPQQ